MVFGILLPVTKKRNQNLNDTNDTMRPGGWNADDTDQTDLPDYFQRFLRFPRALILVKIKRRKHFC